MPANPLYTNFKNIHDDFQLLAKKHKQINSFGLGDLDQMSYWTQIRDHQPNPTFESPYFPLLYVVPGECANSIQYKTWNFQLIMSDIVDRDLVNQVDVLSDTLQMLQDVVSQFRLSTSPVLGCYNTYYSELASVPFTPFMEEYSDLTNGWTAQLQITTTTALDRCAAAFQDFTGNTYHEGINFKTIHDDFRLMADHHKQINSFGFGAYEDLSYWTESRLKQENTTFESPYFPLLYVIPSQATLEAQNVGSSYMNYEFNVVCMDIVDRDLTNQIDVLSDTNQILDDVVAQFRLSVEANMGCFYQEYYIDEEIIYTPFLEKYSDLCGGWSALIKLKVMTPLDRCAAAFQDFDLPTPTSTPLPQPTPSFTPTNTQTPSVTPTNTPSTTPSVTPTNTPSITPTNTPTPSKPSVSVITFTGITSGSTHLAACSTTSPTFNLYTQDVGQCIPCAPNPCWPCLNTTMTLYLDPALTIPAPTGYYKSIVAFSPPAFATWYAVNGLLQPAGYMGC